MKSLAIHRSLVLWCACAALISITALVGWTFGWDSLKGVAGGAVAMNPLTATLLLAASASIWLRREPSIDRRCRRAGLLLGFLVVGAGGVRLAGYLFDLPLNIDRVLFAASLGDNRMAPNTALCMFIFGLGLITLERVARRGSWVAQACALTVAVIATACLVGYAYGAEALYQVSSFIPMAFNTAAALLCLSLGLLFVHPRRGVLGLVFSAGEGGRLARLLFPAALGIPLVVGWGRIAGEQAGWYDARFGNAITVTTMIVLLFAAVSLAASSLNRTDAARREAAERLAEINVELESLIDDRTAQLADANAELVVRAGALEGANQALQQRTKQLARANWQLSERTKELGATNADLVLKSEENEMFVYSVSHDLRSPLVNLQGFSNELSTTAADLSHALETAELPQGQQRRVKRLLDDDMPQSIHFIQSAVTRLSGIIEALLRLSRAGRVEYQLRQVNVSEAAERVVESMSQTIFDRGAEVQIGALPAAYGDPTSIEQVFANLIGNALNYLDPARPGRITVGSRPREQFLSDGSQWTTYFVADNGQGIAEAYHAKVFQALKRLHPNAAKGEGIGLAIVKRIVERHGGTVWFESVAGVGSTFYVDLPASAHGPREGGLDASLASQQGGDYVERSA